MHMHLVTQEPVLRMDARGVRRAAQEVSEGWDVEELRRRQEAWVTACWPVQAGSWVTAERSPEGELELWRDDF